MHGHIVFNGRTYKTVEEMPPEIRRAYEQVMGLFADKNGDGMPDAFEGLASVQAGTIGVQSTTIVYEGRHYQSPDELPADARSKYDQAMGRLDGDRDGVPDVLEGWLAAPVSGAAAPAATTGALREATSQPVVPSPSAIEPEGVSGRWIVLALTAGALLCVAAAAILLFLRT